MAIKTRAGVVPADDKIPFDITTKMVEQFLQEDKIDKLVALMRKNGKNHGDVKVRLISAKCSKKFIPFLILLPTSIIKGSGKNRNEYEPSIFDPEDEDNSVKLEEEFYKLLKCYCFTRDEVEAFFTATWRNELGISLKVAHSLKNSSKPKVQKFNNGKTKFVACFIDPYKVFKDMLTDMNNPDKRFDIEISETHRLSNSDYKYKVSRSDKKNRQNDSFDENLANEVNRMLAN